MQARFLKRKAFSECTEESWFCACRYVSPGHFRHFGMVDSPLHYNYNTSQDTRSQVRRRHSSCYCASLRLFVLRCRLLRCGVCHCTQTSSLRHSQAGAALKRRIVKHMLKMLSYCVSIITVIGLDTVGWHWLCHLPTDLFLRRSHLWGPKGTPHIKTLALQLRSSAGLLSRRAAGSTLSPPQSHRLQGCAT